MQVQQQSKFIIIIVDSSNKQMHLNWICNSIWNFYQCMGVIPWSQYKKLIIQINLINISIRMYDLHTSIIICIWSINDSWVSFDLFVSIKWLLLLLYYVYICLSRILKSFVETVSYENVFFSCVCNIRSLFYINMVIKDNKINHIKSHGGFVFKYEWQNLNPMKIRELEQMLLTNQNIFLW